MNNRLTLLASLICFGVCMMPARSQHDSHSDIPQNTQLQPSSRTPGGTQQTPDGDAQEKVQGTMQDRNNSSSAQTNDEHDQPKFITGGVEQKEIITMPGSAQTPNKTALPTLTLEVPKLDKVPSVPKFLQAGAMFNEKDDAIPAPDSVWYRIPSFLAGSWQCSEKTVTSSVNLLTGRSDFNVKTEDFIQTLHQGFQQDNTGAYWHYDTTPFLGHSIGPNGVVHYSYVQLIEPISCSDKRFVSRSVLTKAQVNGAKVVQTAEQVELIHSLTPLVTGRIRQDTLARILDSQGRPIRQNTSTVVYSMTRPYRTIDRTEGRDLKAMFREYLKSHGMANLVPR